MTDSLSPSVLSARLEDIIRSELSYRLSAPSAASRIDNLIAEVEAHNREVVRRHQEGSLTAALPSLFSTFLSLQPGGRFHARRPSIQLGNYGNYQQAVERFDTLFTSGLMALPDPALSDTVHHYLTLFHEKNDRLMLLLQYLKEAETLERKIHSLVPESPGIIANAAGFLSENAAPLEDEIRRIRHCARAFSSDPYLENALSRLNQQLLAIERKLGGKTRKAVGFLTDEAARLFQEFKATTVDAAHLPTLLAQQENLAGLADYFQAARLPDREKRIRDMIGIMEGSITVIYKETDRQKTREAHHYQRNQAHLNDLRDRFARIQEDFAAGRFDSAGKRKKTGRELHRLNKALNAAELTEVVEDIRAFMAATGIGLATEKNPAPETGTKPHPALKHSDGLSTDPVKSRPDASVAPNRPEEVYPHSRRASTSPFYRRGFFFLLLINILLLITTVLLTGLVI